MVDLNHLAEDPFQETYYINHHHEDYILPHLNPLQRNLFTYLGNGTSHLPIDRFIGNPFQFRCGILSQHFSTLTFICGIRLASDSSFRFTFQLQIIDQQQTGERTLAEGTFHFTSTNLRTAIIDGELTLYRISWLIQYGIICEERITSRQHSYCVHRNRIID